MKTENIPDDVMEVLSSAKCLLMSIGVMEGHQYPLYPDIDKVAKEIVRVQEILAS